jgi:hypothetical protein
MPLMYSYKLRRLPNEYPTSIPMSILNEEWADKIHGQSLKELASRGGLCAQEAVGNINKLSGLQIVKMSLEDALEQLQVILKGA